MNQPDTWICKECGRTLGYTRKGNFFGQWIVGRIYKCPHHPQGAIKKLGRKQWTVLA